METSRQTKLAKNTVILTIGKISTQCVSFLLLPLYTSLLNPSDYGIVELLSTYSALLLPLFNWQIEMGLFRYMLDARTNDSKLRILLSTIINVNHLQTILFLCLFFLLQRFIYSPYKYFLAILVVINIYLNTFLQSARGFGHNDVYAIASFLSASIAIFLNIIFIVGFKMGAIGMILGVIISNFLAIIYLIFALKIWKYYIFLLISKDETKEILHYSLPLIPNQLSWWVVGVSDRVIVSNLLGIGMNGIYSVANKFSTMYISFYNIFNLAWTESCALHINDNDSGTFFSDVLSNMFSLFSSICIGIVSCMPFVFPLVIADSYNESYFQIPILMTAVLCQSIVGLVSVVYTAKKLSKILAKTSFIIAIINIVTNLLLIKYIGLYAASFSTLIAYGGMMIYRCIDVKKYIDVKYPAKKIVKFIIVFLISIYSYYSNTYILQISTLIITVVYALLENKTLLFNVINYLTSKRKVVREN